MEPMPAGSKTDPLLGEAELISNSGNIPEIMSLRKEGKKKPCAIAERERSDNSAAPQVGEIGGAPGARAEIPLQPVVRQAVPLKPIEANRSLPTAHGG